MSCLHLKDLAAFCACNRALRALLADQPEAVWQTAAETLPAPGVNKRLAWLACVPCHSC